MFDLAETMWLAYTNFSRHHIIRMPIFVEGFVTHFIRYCVVPNLQKTKNNNDTEIGLYIGFHRTPSRPVRNLKSYFTSLL